MQRDASLDATLDASLDATLDGTLRGASRQEGAGDGDATLDAKAPGTFEGTSLECTLDEVASRVGAHFEQGRGGVDVPRYHQKRELGAGGMGRVVLADDNALQRPVAMKVLHTVDEEHRRAFSREAGIAGRLEHPNIVPLYDAGVDESGAPYLTMRYVEGVTLKVIIDRLRGCDEEALRSWPIEARCRVVLQLLSALQLAHARGIIHRDLKPENVMVGPFGEVFLVDWGIACAPEESASEEGLVGTIAYMSPEQAVGAALDARSDLYSLSVMFYELLTLKHPYPGLPRETMAALLASVNTKIVAAELVRAKGQLAVPRSLSLIVMRGLERERDKRWFSASSMEAAIREHLAGQAPVVCPHTAYSRGLSVMGRLLDAYPRATIVATLALFGLAIGEVVHIGGVVASLSAP